MGASLKLRLEIYEKPGSSQDRDGTAELETARDQLIAGLRAKGFQVIVTQGPLICGGVRRKEPKAPKPPTPVRLGKPDHLR